MPQKEIEEEGEGEGREDEEGEQKVLGVGGGGGGGLFDNDDDPYGLFTAKPLQQQPSGTSYFATSQVRPVETRHRPLARDSAV
jgi:hypothetical protein